MQGEPVRATKIQPLARALTIVQLGRFALLVPEPLLRFIEQRFKFKIEEGIAVGMIVTKRSAVEHMHIVPAFLYLGENVARSFAARKSD